MEIIVGTIVMQNNKILMVKEAKKMCYGKWSFPAGHLEDNETLGEGAKRETLEETGYKTKLKKSFPIFTRNDSKLKILMVYFLAEPIEYKINFDTTEIMETKWVDIEELKNMDKNDLRSHAIVEQIIQTLESGTLYNLEIIKEKPNI